MDRLKELGVVGALAAYPFILAAEALSPWFNIFDNDLSDLGNIAFNGEVAYVFNAGLVVSGALLLAFAVQLSRQAHDRRELVWTAPFAVSSLDLAFVGVLSEDAGVVHWDVSVVFFTMTAVTMLAYSYVSWPLGAPRVGALALVFGILSVAIWFVEWPWTGVAIQETVTSGMSAIWLILVALRL